MVLPHVLAGVPMVAWYALGGTTAGLLGYVVLRETHVLGPHQSTEPVGSSAAALTAVSQGAPPTLDASVSQPQATAVATALQVETNSGNLKQFAEAMTPEFPVAHSLLLAKANVLDGLSNSTTGADGDDADEQLALLTGLNKVLSVAVDIPISAVIPKRASRHGKQLAQAYLDGKRGGPAHTLVDFAALAVKDPPGPSEKDNPLLGGKALTDAPLSDDDGAMPPDDVQDIIGLDFGGLGGAVAKALGNIVSSQGGTGIVATVGTTPVHAIGRARAGSGSSPSSGSSGTGATSTVPKTLCDQALDSFHRRSPVWFDLCYQCLKTGGKVGNTGLTLASLQRTKDMRAAKAKVARAVCDAAVRAIYMGSPYAPDLVAQCRASGFTITFDEAKWHAYYYTVWKNYWPDSTFDEWGTPHEPWMPGSPNDPATVARNKAAGVLGNPRPTWQMSPDIQDWPKIIREAPEFDHVWSGDMAMLFGSSAKLCAALISGQVDQYYLRARAIQLSRDGFGKVAAGKSTVRVTFTITTTDFGPLQGIVDFIGAIVKAIDKVLPEIGAILKAAAPFVALIPGVGTGIAAMMTAAGALCCNESLEDMLIDITGSVIPAGPYQQGYRAAAHAVDEMAHGQNILTVLQKEGRDTVVALGGPNAAKAWDTCVATIQGKPIDATLLKAARDQVGSSMGTEGLMAFDVAHGVLTGDSAGKIGLQCVRDGVQGMNDPKMLAAFDVGVAAAQGKSFKDIALQGIIDLVPGADIDSKISMVQQALPFISDYAKEAGLDIGNIAKQYFGQDLADKLLSACPNLDSWAKQGNQIKDAITSVTKNVNLADMVPDDLARQLKIPVDVATAVLAAVNKIGNIVTVDPDLLNMFAPYTNSMENHLYAQVNALVSNNASIIKALVVPASKNAIDNTKLAAATAAANMAPAAQAAMQAAQQQLATRQKWVDYYLSRAPGKTD